MNKTAVTFLIGAGILMVISELFGGRWPMSVYVMSLLLLTVLMYVVFSRSRKLKNEEQDDQALESMRDAQKIKIARSEVKAKIPKNSPRRESPAAFEGSAKLGAARSMAVLVRKPRLREKILEICDFADMVLETIRRMPADTPAAVAFAENHLARLNDALERCFEMSRHDEYRNAPESLDTQEIECFSTFITAFKKQQENILTEGKSF
jgi:Ca2+/Na+ antiporter